jgi:hypothetical protein
MLMRNEVVGWVWNLIPQDVAKEMDICISEVEECKISSS